MLTKAINRLGKHNLKRFYLQFGNAFDLPFKGSEFDVIVNNYMFDLLPEDGFESILLEFKRVLTPSGRVAITTMAHGAKWFNRFWTWTAEHFPRLLTGCRPVSLRPFFVKAGFSNIQIVQLSQNTFASEIVSAECNPER